MGRDPRGMGHGPRSAVMGHGPRSAGDGPWAWARAATRGGGGGAPFALPPGGISKGALPPLPPGGLCLARATAMRRPSGFHFSDLDRLARAATQDLLHHPVLVLADRPRLGDHDRVA